MCGVLAHLGNSAQALCTKAFVILFWFSLKVGRGSVQMFCYYLLEIRSCSCIIPQGYLFENCNFEKKNKKQKTFSNALCQVNLLGPSDVYTYSIHTHLNNFKYSLYNDTFIIQIELVVAEIHSVKVKLLPKCNLGFFCECIWVKPSCKSIITTKDALLRFTVFSFLGQTLF